MHESRPPQSATAVRLILLVDRPLLAEGLEALFTRSESMQVAASPRRLDDVAACVQEHPADAALIDFNLANGTAVLAPRLFRRLAPAARLAMLDDRFHECRLFAACRLRVPGYFTQDDPFAALCAGLAKVAAGGTAVSPAAEPFLGAERSDAASVGSTDSPVLYRLTRRELEILVQLARGLSIKQCAQLLGISPNTVDNHKSRLMGKLGVHKSADLVRLAVREGLLD